MKTKKGIIMFKEFFKIDKKFGESRFAQVSGIVLGIVTFVGAIIYNYYH